MVQQKLCQACNQRHDCKKLYEQLDKAKGPSVVSRVVVAFLLPMVVFIASLVVFDHILAKVMNTEELQTVLSFLLALAVTAVCILIIKAISGKLSKNK